MIMHKHTCPKCKEVFESRRKRQKFCSISCSSSRKSDTCKNGHEMTTKNTYLYRGYAICRSCHRNSRRKWQKKNPESVKKQVQKWHTDNPERAKQLSAEYYQNNKDKVKQQAKKWKENNPERAKDIQLKKYGITAKDYDRRLEEQNNLCGICSGSRGKRNFHVDHDHVTGNVRGLLCSTCNSGLGMLKDGPDLLKKALIYLEEHSSIKENTHG